MPRACAFLLCLSALLLPARAAAQDRPAFEGELDRLRRDLGIPALSAAVVESGTTVWVRHLGFTPGRGEAVRYPVASLTKPFAAVLALQLANRGSLKLDAIRGLLSHTSTGPFVYSSELFATVEPAIERAAGRTFASALAAQVFRPAGLRHTTATARTTPSHGIESTVEDLARFAAAVERGTLLSGRLRTEMFRPARGPTGQALPYALGWFVQYVGGHEVRWHFGQQEGSSSLLMMLPRQRLALVVLARTDRLSAPFWLQMGDIRWSPVASAFLTAWARVRVDLPEARRVMTRALMALHASRRADARAAVAKALVLAPALGDAADGALLAAFARSGDAELRASGRRIAKRLLAVDARHPRTLLDLAVLNLQDGHTDEAAKLLEQVVADGRAPPEILRTTEALLEELERP